MPTRDELQNWLADVLEDEGEAAGSSQQSPVEPNLSDQFARMEMKMFGCVSSQWYQDLDSNEAPYNSARLTTEMVANYVGPSGQRTLEQVRTNAAEFSNFHFYKHS